MDNANLENIDLDNLEFQNAWNLIRNTRRSVFLTGKAGTGKSTFLKYICANTSKEHVVLAPTGIAAVNVGGQTLHSFFKIPFKPLLPDDPDFSPRRIRKTLRYSAQKVKLIRKLQLIIIDEISMVRCDIIDFIDKVLRIYSGNMREPFGGKQLLFVGDIFQLEPVITRDMRDILRRYYKQFFFFNAKVFSNLGLIPIELRKIYRQTDSSFISMLDRVRVSHASESDLRLLNSRCDLNYQEPSNGLVMTLATRRDTVDSINDAHMQALDTPEYVFNGVVTDVFPDNDLPTSKELTLKQGAQVIFIRNDREGRWVNGSLGKVYRLDEDGIQVELENGDCYLVEQEIWE
ncbi:MAG: AAA family ATPase, partial [Muribaculaceae bacterium]|nr:AAA family ATPase [Muribaculaceae bacterium]